MAKGAFSRISDILKSNINEMLDRAEEPDKMIRQMVRDMGRGSRQGHGLGRDRCGQPQAARAPVQR